MKKEGKRARISLRRIVSLTLLLSGAAVVVTSVVLFNGPTTCRERGGKGEGSYDRRNH